MNCFESVDAYETRINIGYFADFAVVIETEE